MTMSVFRTRTSNIFFDSELGLCACFISASLLGAFLVCARLLRRGAEVREAGRSVFERAPKKCERSRTIKNIEKRSSKEIL